MKNVTKNILRTIIVGLGIMSVLVLITIAALAMVGLGISIILVSILIQRNMLLSIIIGTVLIYMSFLYCKGIFEGFEEIAKENSYIKKLKENTKCTEPKEYKIEQDEIEEFNRQYILYKKNPRPSMKCYELELCYQIKEISKMNENMQILIHNIDSKYRKHIKETLYKLDKKLIQNIIDCFRYMNYKNIDSSKIKQTVERIIRINGNLINKEQNFFNKYFDMITEKMLQERKEEMETLEIEMEISDKLINSMNITIY